MKTLFELCRPRESVFSETKRDDVLNLSDLVDNRINPNDFFDENFITQGMNILFETAFRRFKRQNSTSVIKLTQAMGGGKTHNMIALGLLAKYPEFREKIMGQNYKNDYLGKIKVVAFTGRESDAPYGIWGSIAEQLGKKEVFKDYYSPLAAPGENAWIRLLQGEPLLILLDELPPYLENAKSRMIGNSDLSVVTTTALSNLFSALGKEQLSNVCLVISDLKSTYESGSELLQSTFKELENEVNRSALDIEPVGSGSDEVYYILKKRLFKEVPDDNEINDVAMAYKESVNEAKQMGFTSMSGDQLYIAAKDSYPFHPSIKDLYARFKENPGFQQTRGLIRLMRQIVAQLYTGENCKAKSKYMINVFDFDLNDRNMLTTVTQLKQSLTNAISHDIASGGNAIAEQIDAVYGKNVVQDVAKLILVASLADVPHALLGLSLSEIIGDLCEPKKDITGIKKALEEFEMKAWYLDHDKDGRLFFKNTKNMIAQMQSLVELYNNEQAKMDLKKLLKEKFVPSTKDCYQEVEVFPAIDEINLSIDKVTLVLFEPYSGAKIHPDLQKFYDSTPYKNRVMFLSGKRDTMDRLYKAAKELKAIRTIIADMKDEKVSESNQQYQIACDMEIKKIMAVLECARQTFVTLYFPNKNGIAETYFLMQFKSSKYNGEEQIRQALKDKMKFTEDSSGELFIKKCEDRLFTRKEMTWNEIEERAATNTSWQWHHLKALETIKSECIKKDRWREHGGYIEKGPFEKDPTSVKIQTINVNYETGEATLKIFPVYGDKIYYEVGGIATTASSRVDNLINFKTHEIELSFLCIDSSNEHPTGKAVTWRNQVKIKYKITDKIDGIYLTLRSHPKVIIKYTTDGSNPKENGGVYEGEFMISENTAFVEAVAEYKEEYFETETIKIDRKNRKEINIDNSKPLKLYKDFNCKDTNATYKDIESLKKFNATIRDIEINLVKDENSEEGWIQLSMDKSTKVDLNKLCQTIDNLKSSFMNDTKANISLDYNIVEFNKGEEFIDWVNEKGLSLSEFRETEIIQ
ncbi:DUF499 domain-containing protein [Clostridium autoethanogenum]|uniref:DUF499 domain-containing protein n=1 Tax=Clostridium autoethanogenum DSM 10061 TaxID=1341692 RepID=A0ABN4BDV5_9CLOT|nr:DUF499 domain-containing protein [Clostridium autoethanogenum]AGY75873.1 DUF499 domain-containing protein [Clostridium autoethanogenum DSM 10061]ALU36039.1 Fn3 associated repeat-containing protein [Clostridium autoethanogenum DSM 10061]OVY51903.1 hypothetical protein WX72_00780 [Clostridium autoethanogenum]